MQLRSKLSKQHSSQTLQIKDTQNSNSLCCGSAWARRSCYIVVPFCLSILEARTTKHTILAPQGIF